jgi:hypothetical protein
MNTALIRSTQVAPCQRCHATTSARSVQHTDRPQQVQVEHQAAVVDIGQHDSCRNDCNESHHRPGEATFAELGCTPDGHSKKGGCFQYAGHIGPVDHEVPAEIGVDVVPKIEWLDRGAGPQRQPDPYQHRRAHKDEDGRQLPPVLPPVLLPIGNGPDCHRRGQPYAHKGIDQENQACGHRGPAKALCLAVCQGHQ